MEKIMNTTRIYAARGGWIFEVWTASRLVVLGWCTTREHAEEQAALA
jgi:hypothetical protein